MAETEHEYFLQAVVKKFEGKFAVLETDDGQELRWPIKNLPDDAQAGQSVRLIISTAQSEHADREKLAQAVINKILRE